MSPKIRTVSAKGIHVNYGSYEITAPLPDPIPEGATNVRWDGETLTLSWEIPQEEGDPQEGSMELTQGDLDAALSYTPPAPVPPVPQSVNRKDFFLAAATVALTKTDMQAAIDAITDAQTQQLAQIEFDESIRFTRDWPLLESMASGFGITGEQLDNLFRLAKSYEGRSALG